MVLCFPTSGGVGVSCSGGVEVLVSAHHDVWIQSNRCCQSDGTVVFRRRAAWPVLAEASSRRSVCFVVYACVYTYVCAAEAWVAGGMELP